MSDNSIKSLKPHVSLNVRNISDSVEFYKKLFGIEPLKYIRGNTTTHSIVRENLGLESEKPRFGYAKFDVENPPLNFVLNEVPYTEGGTLSHLGIQVESTDDVLKTRERWVAEGLLTVDEMNVDCCYALQDKPGHATRTAMNGKFSSFSETPNRRPPLAPAAARSRRQQFHPPFVAPTRRKLLLLVRQISLAVNPEHRCRTNHSLHWPFTPAKTEATTTGPSQSRYIPLRSSLS